MSVHVKILTFTVDKVPNLSTVFYYIAMELPKYYNNDKGSLYKVANERNWNAYLFDVVKRLERGGKKDPIKQEIEKSIGVLQLWLSELEK